MTTIDFNKGKPSTDLLPTKLFLDASCKIFSRPKAAEDILQYGLALGNDEFLNNLAHFLTKEYDCLPAVSSRHLCATPGASLMLQHILTLLTRPQTKTRHVYFQDPTYFLVFDIFRDVGFVDDQFTAIPEEDSSGMNLDVLQEHLERNKYCHSYIGKEKEENNIPSVYDSVLYCVPTHSNPTGSILSNKKRRQLVELGRKYNMLIVCDDVYDILTFEKEENTSSNTRLVAFDLNTNKLDETWQQHRSVVISNGSFSKLLAPGARVGWIEAGEDLIKTVGLCGSFISGSSPSCLSSALINEMLIDGSLCCKTQDRLSYALLKNI